MGKNQYTELDKLFRSKLGEDKLSSGDWNEPTDDIFLAAMEKVNKPAEVSRKKKRTIWPFFLIPFFALLSISVWNSIEVDSLKSTINEMQEENISKGEQIGLNQAVNRSENTTLVSSAVMGADALSGNENLQTKEKNELASRTASFTPAKSKNIKTNHFSTTKRATAQSTVTTIEHNNGGSQLIPPSQSSNSSFLHGDGLNSKRFVPLSTSTDERQGSMVSSTGNMATINKLLGLSLLPQYGGLLNIKDRALIDLNQNPFAIANAKTESQSKGLAFYAFMDLNLNSLRMSGLQSGEFSLTEYDKSYLGYNIGVGALQDINKRFGISYNLAYRHVMNKSFYTQEMAYNEDKTKEGLDGQLLYELDMDVETPIGAFTLREDVSMADATMADQDMMLNTTDIKQTFNFLSLGVHPRVNVLSTQRFNLFAEAGLNVNYLLGFCQNLDLKMYYGSDMVMNPVPMEDHNMATLNRISLAGSLGLGVEYNFGEHVFSSFKLGGSRSLNSIRQTNNTDAVETFIDNIGVSLTAGYKF